MNERNKCPIWGTGCEDFSPTGLDGRRVDSPRAGGRYEVSGSIISTVEKLGDLQKTVLSRWIYEQNLAKNDANISSESIKKILWRQLPSVPTRIDYFLQFVELEANGAIGADVSCSGTMLAAMAVKDPDEMNYIIRQAESKKWVKVKWMGSIPPTIGEITADGYQRLEDLRSAQPNSVQTFVAMWFDDAMNDAWEKGFEPAIVDAGYKPMRIDRKEHINKIDDEIIAEIRRSRFVVADFTSRPKEARGGVYYEAGFAHGMNIPVIYTCREDCLDDIHFDTRQFNHLTWKTPEVLRTDLAKRISAVIGDGPHRERKQDW